MADLSDLKCYISYMAGRTPTMTSSFGTVTVDSSMIANMSFEFDVVLKPEPWPEELQPLADAAKRSIDNAGRTAFGLRTALRAALEVVEKELDTSIRADIDSMSGKSTVSVLTIPPDIGRGSPPLDGAIRHYDQTQARWRWMVPKNPAPVAGVHEWGEEYKDYVDDRPLCSCPKEIVSLQGCKCGGR